jgi:hypothetical protein
MTASLLEKIDWSRPWLAHVKSVGQAVAAAPDWRAELNRRAAQCDLRNHRGLPIQFVPQAELPSGVPYESHISRSGGVPTRDNLHDFFNALVWLTFPRIKTQLNALQARELEKGNSSQTQAARGRLRDAATIFDENAVLLVTANQSLIDGLRAHRWAEVFVEHRKDFVQECRLYLFGHALMEKLVAPYKAITGHMWVLPEILDGADSVIGRIDGQLGRQLAEGLTTDDFSPLPVLGVPEWWDGQDENFYLDRSVFRPASRTIK